MNVLVTRPPGSWPGLAPRFRDRGVSITMAATTVQVEPLDAAPGDDAIARLDSYDWLVVTSGRGASVLARRLVAEEGGSVIDSSA